MKKRVAFFAIPALFLASFCFSHAAFAASKAQQYLGEAEMCVDIHRIDQTRIIDNQTILFIMRGGTRYLNRLPFKCSGLMLAGGFGYETTMSQLCMQYRITTLNPGGTLGSTCLLGRFIPFKADMRDNEVVKLLKDGLLKGLVSEGAFEEVPPSE